MGNQNQNASNNQSTLQQPIKFEFRWLELKRQKCGVKKKKKEIGLAVSMVPFLLMFVLFLYKHNGFLSQP